MEVRGLGGVGWGVGGWRTAAQPSASLRQRLSPPATRAHLITHLTPLIAPPAPLPGPPTPLHKAHHELDRHARKHLLQLCALRAVADEREARARQLLQHALQRRNVFLCAPAQQCGWGVGEMVVKACARCGRSNGSTMQGLWAYSVRRTAAPRRAPRAPRPRTRAKAPDVHQQRRVRVAVAHARPHVCAAVAGVEHVSVHAALPHVDALVAAPVAREFLLLGEGEQVGCGERWVMSGARSRVPRHLRPAACSAAACGIAPLPHPTSQAGAARPWPRGPTTSSPGSAPQPPSSPHAPPAPPAVGRTFMALEVTSVRSARRVHQRMMDHIGSTRPFQV